MTYEELQQKIADVMEMIDVRYKGAIKAHYKYLDGLEKGRIVVKPEPDRTLFEHQAYRLIEKLKKDFAMQDTPADIGDVIRTEKYMMKVDRIEVGASDYPQLQFYGIYLKRDGTPLSRQIGLPIQQRDIIRVVKNSPNGPKIKKLQTY